MIADGLVILDLVRESEGFSDSVAAIGMGPFSQFARRVFSFLPTPMSDTEDVIVLNPSDPTEYEGRIFYFVPV
jgi:hypothetical protein